MNTPNTTARPSVDLDATDEFPVLDAAAYEAEALSRESADRTDSWAIAAGAEARAALLSADADGHPVPRSPPPATDSDGMLAIEHWIAQKTEELRAHHEALSLAQRERAAATARAGALSRELAETSASLEALKGREQALTEALTREQEAVQSRATELEAARSEAALLSRELAEARAAEAERTSALTASEALLEQRSGELQALQRTHEALIADQQRAARELSDLQSQLAGCVESLHSRESYRGIYESAVAELEAELTAAKRQVAEQEARANQLYAELQSRDRRLQSTVQERDEARQRHDSEITQREAERGEGERRRSALEARLAELTAEHAEARARALTMEAALRAAEQRADAAALAGGAVTERVRELEAAAASREAELTEARLESERNRALLADLTAALLKSQTLCADQSRLLEERDAAASTMAASHAEQTALITTLGGHIDELTARLEAPEAERRALEERIAMLSKEAVESEHRLARLESMNLELRATVGRLTRSLADREGELQRATQIASMNTYALGRVQSSIDEIGRTLAASEGGATQAQVSVLTRIDSGQNHSVVLRGRTTIGRDRDNDLPLPMRSVSRHHAVLIPAFRTAFVQDMSSTNGVLVNQRRVRCARLEHGDLVTFGEAQFRYTVAPAPAGAVPIGAGSTRIPLKLAP